MNKFTNKLKIAGSFVKKNACKLATLCSTPVVFFMIFTPMRFACNRYNRDWDEYFNDLIENPKTEFIKFTEHTVVVKNEAGKTAKIWISNFPYSYGHAYNSTWSDSPYDIAPNDLRPSFYNVIRFDKLVIQKQLNTVK